MPVTQTITDTENLTLTLVAELAAPVERVWQAFGDPRQLSRFWGPPGWPATFTSYDQTVGGRARYAMTGPRGESAGGEWEFVSIEAPHQLVILDRFVDAEGKINEELPTTRMTLTLEPDPSGTRLSVVSTFDSAEALDQLVGMGMVEGAQQAMNQLDLVLADLRDHFQGKGTQVEVLDDTHVRITRLINGPQELVWRAHHEPELIKQWMLGPDGWEITEVTTAEAPGERYRTTWAPVGDTPGEPFGFEGELLLSEPQTRQVTTEQMQGTSSPVTLNDLNLHGEGSVTLLTLYIEYPDAETREMILGTGMVDGMEQSYVRLENTVLAPDTASH